MEEHVHKHRHKHKRKHSDSVTISDVALACDSDIPKSAKRARVEDLIADESVSGRQSENGVVDGRKCKHKKHRKREDGVEVQDMVSRIEESSPTCSPSARQKVKKKKRTTEDDEVTGKVNATSNHDPVSTATVNGDGSSEHKAKRTKKTTATEPSVQANGEQLDQSGGEQEVEEASRKKKKKRKAGKASTPQQSPGGCVGKESALQYLHSWEERREWSFKKKIQYWLLQHMYDKHQVCVSCRGT